MKKKNSHKIYYTDLLLRKNIYIYISPPKLTTPIYCYGKIYHPQSSLHRSIVTENKNTANHKKKFKIFISETAVTGKNNSLFSNQHDLPIKCSNYKDSGSGADKCRCNSKNNLYGLI
jgi:hypothetical protein